MEVAVLEQHAVDGDACGSCELADGVRLDEVRASRNRDVAVLEQHAVHRDAARRHLLGDDVCRETADHGPVPFDSEDGGLDYDRVITRASAVLVKGQKRDVVRGVTELAVAGGSKIVAAFVTEAHTAGCRHIEEQARGTRQEHARAADGQWRKHVVDAAVPVRSFLAIIARALVRARRCREDHVTCRALVERERLGKVDLVDPVVARPDRNVVACGVVVVVDVVGVTAGRRNDRHARAPRSRQDRPGRRKVDGNATG